MIGKIINTFFKPFGVRISRLQKTNNIESPPEVLRNINDVIYMQGLPFLYKPVALEVPVNKIINPLGYKFGSNDYNPFVQTLRNQALKYEVSALKKYYDNFQPSNAAEALGANFHKPFKLNELPAYSCRFLTPWSSHTPESAIKQVQIDTLNENREYGNLNIGIEGGDLLHGPVKLEKGEIEFKRLKRVFDSIKKNGYKRNNSLDGDIKVYLLKKGDEYRYLILSGNHRLAAAVALGMEYIPVRLLAYHIINLDDIDSWPQVRIGLWDKENAKIYFNYLFE